MHDDDFRQRIDERILLQFEQDTERIFRTTEFSKHRGFENTRIDVATMLSESQERVRCLSCEGDGFTCTLDRAINDGADELQPCELEFGKQRLLEQFLRTIRNLQCLRKSSYIRQRIRMIPQRRRPTPITKSDGYSATFNSFATSTASSVMRRAFAGEPASMVGRTRSSNWRTTPAVRHPSAFRRRVRHQAVGPVRASSTMAAPAASSRSRRPLIDSRSVSRDFATGSAALSQTAGWRRAAANRRCSPMLVEHSGQSARWAAISSRCSEVPSAYSKSANSS